LRRNFFIRLAVMSCLMIGSAGAQISPEDSHLQQVLGEQTQGSLLREGKLECEVWQLTPAEVTGCGLDRKSPVVAESPALPPILISVDSGTYVQVPRVVYDTVLEPVATPAPAHNPAIRRRRSLASRGAHSAPKVSYRRVSVPRTVYRTVYRRQGKKLDISPIIHKYADKFQLDPWLLRGVIEVESAFRPYATSCAGAGGLMQLMPGTASYLGCRNRFDPEQNIAAGARYLRQMLNRFQGDYNLAIAAYNAGPGNVERYGGIPPFAETQNYVRKVRRAWGKKPVS
jgi:hypothetical protein